MKPKKIYVFIVFEHSEHSEDSTLMEVFDLKSKATKYGKKKLREDMSRGRDGTHYTTVKRELL